MQKALVIVSEGIKPFSTRLESLSMKLANFVRLTDCSIGQEPARPQAPKNRRRIHWNTVRIFRGQEHSRGLAVVRRSRTVNVGQAPIAMFLPILRRKKDVHLGDHE
jgi:hypothetical protein